MRPDLQRAVKRTIDASAAGTLLVGLSPVLVYAALAVIMEDGLPVLFRQRRSGQAGREFEVRKFRSMRRHQTALGDVGPSRDEQELITRVGHWMRRLKIDELPQLVNVLRGEMSLVGPRPTLPSQVRDYDAYQRRRLEVRPGMTGWAQINGNTQLSWSERIALDIWYVDHWSLELDLNIMLRTIGVVFRGERPAPEALREAQEYADGAGWRSGKHSGRA